MLDSSRNTRKSVGSTNRVSNKSRESAAKKTAAKQQKEVRRQQNLQRIEALRIQVRPGQSPQNPTSGAQSRADRTPEENAKDKTARVIPFETIKGVGASAAAGVSDLKRELLKKKAGRQFSSQFHDAPAASDAGPRAAVYKGEMGRNHRRAAAMQNEGGEGNGSHAGKMSLGAAISSFLTSRKFIVSMGAAACIVAACVFLYPSAQQFYLATREHDRLQAELTAVTTRNDKLQTENDYLQSDSGVKQRAREEYGWTMPGEDSISVYGLENSDDEDKVARGIISSEIKPPVTWYSPILDPLFGLEIE